MINSAISVGVLVAARTASSRLPGKALLPLGGKPMICFLIDRLRRSTRADAIVLATTTLASDDELAAIVEASGTPVFRGDPNDLVQRYVDAGQHFGFDVLVRVTGDCPFVNGETLDHCLDACSDWQTIDIATTKGRFPVGIDFEIFPSDRLTQVLKRADLTDDDREHLTLYMYQNPDDFTVRRIDPPAEWPRGGVFTIDTEDDYRKACNLVARLGCNSFSIGDLISAATT